MKLRNNEDLKVELMNEWKPLQEKIDNLEKLLSNEDSLKNFSPLYQYILTNQYNSMLIYADTLKIRLAILETQTNSKEDVQDK